MKKKECQVKEEIKSKRTNKQKPPEEKLENSTNNKRERRMRTKRN